MSNIPAILEKDYPSIYQAADKASKQAQSNYIFFIGIDLIAMVIASGMAIYNFNSISITTTIYVISGFFLLLGLIFSVVILTKKYEDTWYQGRALAESCKTLTWRFIMRSEYFENFIDLTEAKKRFVERIKDLNDEFKELNKVMNSKILIKPIITDIMLQIRELNVADRKDYYIKNRIENQQIWYSTKAEFNKIRYNAWFSVIITSQLLSLISIVFLIKFPSSNWTVVGLFTTIASAAISWLQLKQHQELKQAYTTASQELNFIVTLSYNVTSNEEFASFVLDSENAISREHTLWLAQKRN